MRKYCQPHRLSGRSIALFSLLAFAFHALIPVGYMPDFSGRSNNLFALTLCDGVDHAHMHHHSGAPHDEGEHAPCPYSIGALYTFGNLSGPILSVPVFILLPSTLPAEDPFIERPDFATASPRAPPYFS